MTTKQRAYLKGLAMTMDPIFQIGKSSMTPEFTKAIAEALQNMWQTELGVTVNLSNQDWNVFLKSRKDGDFQHVTAGLLTTMIRALSWICGIPAVETTMHSTLIRSMML